MKKKLLITLTAGLMLSAAGTAFAADEASSDQKIKIDGSLYMQWRSQRDTNFTNKHDTYTRNGFKSLLTLNIDAPLNKNVDVYTSMAYEKLQHDWGKFMSDYQVSQEQHYAAVTAYGINYKNAGFSYNLGKQFATFGLGNVYDSTGNIDRYNAPYALNVNGKVGATNLNLIVAKTNYQEGLTNDKLYAVQANYDINPKTNIGAMFAHASYGDSTVSLYKLPKDHVNYYSVYGSYKLSNKATLSSEYSQATAKSDDKAFQASLKYKLDGKNSLGLTYYYCEDQANIFDYNLGGATTGLANNTKGALVSYTHKFDKTTSGNVSNYFFSKINNTSIGDNAPTNDRNRFYASLTVTF